MDMSESRFKPLPSVCQLWHVLGQPCDMYMALQVVTSIKMIFVLSVGTLLPILTHFGQ